MFLNMFGSNDATNGFQIQFLFKFCPKAFKTSEERGGGAFVPNSLKVQTHICRLIETNADIILRR
jgi:hypothetical protein